MHLLTVIFLVPFCTVNLALAANEGRVVGGSIAPIGAFPYQISFRRNPGGQHFCGGSIIGPKVILTAGHCGYAIKNDISNAYVVVGTNKLNKGGDTYELSRVHIHPLYRARGAINDISLLILKSEISFNEVVGPISLALFTPKGGSQAVLSGWGFTGYPNGSISNDLKQVTLGTITLEECREKLPEDSRDVNRGQLCTLSEIGQGACFGDSGGPLALGTRQIGIVSWGFPCALGVPDVFTNVARYRLWIKIMSGV